MQFETSYKPQDVQNTSCIPQPEWLRRAPFNASDVTDKKEVKMYPKQHGEICDILVECLHFIDSLNFLQKSLDSLVSETPKKSLKITSTISKGSDLLYKKRIYPYEYMDSWARFSETRLPDKEKFYSKLNDEHITDEEYSHAQTVWETFECKTLGDYHDLYVKTDVALLADVFENFRNLCQEKYALDPAHYFTSPGLSWDALLKKTGVELELFTDLEMRKWNSWKVEFVVEFPW